MNVCASVFKEKSERAQTRPLPILLFFVFFLLFFWAEHCFKEAFLLVTSAHFGRICSHFCSLKCANYSYSQRLQLHGSCAGCLGAIVHIYMRHRLYIFCFCLYDIMILQHHILCRFLEVGPCPPAQTVGTCPVNRAPKTITSYN